MPGLLDFVTRLDNPRSVTRMIGTYTMLSTDEYITFTGSAVATLTLLDLNSMDGTFVKKRLIIQNNGTATLTIAVPTTSPVQTVNGSTSINLPPGFSITLMARVGSSDWSLDGSSPLPVDLTNVVTVIKTFTTSGTQNLFNTSTAPVNGQLLAAMVISGDINTSNIVISNAGNTSTTIAKSATSGLIVGGVISYPTITKGTAVTVSNGSSAACTVVVDIAVQPLGI